MSTESNFAYIRPLSRWIFAGFILAAVVVAFEGAQPPRPKPLDAPPTEFSGMRAMAHSHKFAIEPRPRGGAAAARGRDYLVNALKEIGCEVEVSREPVNQVTSVNFVENVMARIPGTGGNQTLGMTAHYDSVAWGPGAADCGAGVVVMLEAARALKCGPPLKNDVVFVFTADEEGGGNASVIALKHRWLKDLNIMIGLEGRGDWGTAFMFETSEGNLPLMYELKKSGAPAISNSIMYQVHHQTPNTTDFTHMADHGALGYNVAFVGGLQYYHTANDTPEHLSPRTVQHQGDYVMAIVRHYDKEGPKIAKGEEGVFFNTVGTHLVVYPASYSRPFAIMAIVAFVLALIVGFATRNIGPLGILGGLLLMLLILALTALVEAPMLYGSYKIFYVYVMYNAAWYHIAFMLIGVGIAAGLAGALRKYLCPENLHAAALLLWLATTIVTEWKVPIASYSGTWPLFIGSIGLAAACLLRRFGAPRGVTVFVQILSALPALFIGVPGIHALYHMGGALTPIATTALVLVLVFSLAPALLLTLGGGGKRVAQVCLALGVIVFLLGWLNQRYTPETPKMNGLTYALNMDTQKAIWITTDKESDSWLSQFIPNTPGAGAPAAKALQQQVAPQGNDKPAEPPVPTTLSDNAQGESDIDETMSAFFGRRLSECRVAPAPAAKLDGPELSVVSDTTADGKRELVLRYVSRRSANAARISVLGDAHVLAATVDGMGEVLADSRQWSLNIGYLPYDYQTTFHLTLDAPTPAPVKLRIHEEFFTLPELTTLGYAPRPDWMISKGNTLGWWENSRIDPNHTHLMKTFEF